MKTPESWTGSVSDTFVCGDIIVLVKVARLGGPGGGEMRAAMDVLCPTLLGPLLLLMVLARALFRRPRLGVVGDVGETGGGDFEREGSTAFVSVARLDMFARVARGEKMSKVLGPEDAEGRPG